MKEEDEEDEPIHTDGVWTNYNRHDMNEYIARIDRCQIERLLNDGDVKQETVGGTTK